MPLRALYSADLPVGRRAAAIWTGSTQPLLVFRSIVDHVVTLSLKLIKERVRSSDQTSSCWSAATM